MTIETHLVAVQVHPVHDQLPHAVGSAQLHQLAAGSLGGAQVPEVVADGGQCGAPLRPRTALLQGM